MSGMCSFGVSIYIVKSAAAKVLPVNKPMLAIFHNSGFKVNTEFDGEDYSIAFDL